MSTVDTVDEAIASRQNEYLSFAAGKIQEAREAQHEAAKAVLRSGAPGEIHKAVSLPVGAIDGAASVLSHYVSEVAE